MPVCHVQIAVADSASTGANQNLGSYRCRKAVAYFLQRLAKVHKLITAHSFHSLHHHVSYASPPQGARAYLCKNTDCKSPRNLRELLFLLPFILIFRIVAKQNPWVVPTWAPPCRKLTTLLHPRHPKFSTYFSPVQGSGTTPWTSNSPKFRTGVCQQKCPLFHAAAFMVEGSSCPSFDGLSQTVPSGSQFRVARPFQRSGKARLAVS